MADETVVRIELLADPDTDTEEIDELTRRLRRHIADLDIADVTPVKVAAPPGSKSGYAAAAGEFLVTLVQSAGGVRAIVGTARAWLSHHPNRTIELEIDGDRLKITGASSAAEDRLIDAWIERRSGAAEAT